MPIEKQYWGTTKNNEKVYCYTLKNNDLEVNILNYGGIIQKLLTRNKNGIFENIVLGFNNISEYENDNAHLGAIIGRTSGRIKNGEFYINSTLYKLEKNNGNNNLHGYPSFFSKKIWNVKEYENDHSSILELNYNSPHMEGGFPGNIDFTIKYILKDNSLEIQYVGIPDRDTYISLTNHTYFNLIGEAKENIENQKIFIKSNEFIEVDSETLPIKISNSKNTIFDLNEGKTFKEIFNSNNKQIQIVGNGLDHPFILHHKENYDILCIDKLSGRILKVETTQPVVVVYTGNYLQDIKNIYNNKFCDKHYGFCLETQDYPDGLNFIPEKVSIYNKNNIYFYKTKFIFTVNNSF